MYPDSLKEVFNNCIEEMLIEYLENKIPFSMIVRTVNWNKPLPKRLVVEDMMMIQIKEQTLEDSYFDGKNIYICTQFEGVDNFICLLPQDVQGILSVDMKNPILMKPFKDSPATPALDKVKTSNPMLNFKQEELTEGVKRSLECFAKSNPNLFKI
jgi:hypothetical protein